MQATNYFNSLYITKDIENSGVAWEEALQQTRL